MKHTWRAVLESSTGNSTVLLTFKTKKSAFKWMSEFLNSNKHWDIAADNYQVQDGVEYQETHVSLWNPRTSEGITLEMVYPEFGQRRVIDDQFGRAYY